jgi:hypothetical protein
MTAKVITAVIALVVLVVAASALHAQRDPTGVPFRFNSGKYIWFMGSDLYPPSGIAELKTLEDQNLVIPNIKQRKLGWPGSYRDIYFSLNDMRKAIADGLSPRVVQIVIYNPEQYTDRRTPASELEDPVNSVRTFAGLAHAKGFIAAYAPSCGLIQAGAMNIWPGRDPTLPAYWRACADNLWSRAASYVDLIDLQVQGIQRTTPEYQAVVVYAARAIRSRNANIKIVAQVSTQVRSASLTSIYAAAYAVHTVVDGYYLSYLWTDPSDQRTIESFLIKAVDTFYSSR